MLNRTMNPLEWGILTLLSILWGGSFFFIEVALRELPPFTLVFLRVAFAASALYVVLRATGGRMPLDWRAWSAFAGMAMLNNVVPFSLLAWGQTQIASGLAAILNATTPLWTVVVAHLLTADEKITQTKTMGLVLGFSGVVFMFGGEALEGFGVAALAQAACLVATLSYALAGIYGRRFREMGISSLVSAYGQLCAAAVILLPVALLVDDPWQIAPPSAITWGAVSSLVLLSTAAAYVLYFRLLATVGATNLLLVTFLIPVTAILLGSFVLGEVLEPKQIFGMAFIGAGLIAIDGRVPLAVWQFFQSRSGCRSGILSRTRCLIFRRSKLSAKPRSLDGGVGVTNNNREFLSYTTVSYISNRPFRAHLMSSRADTKLHSGNSQKLPINK